MGIPAAIYVVSLMEFVTVLAPTFLRKPKTIAWLRALIAPLKTSYDAFVIFKDRQIYITAHNASITLFQQALNDAFDVTERRIYIENAKIVDGDYWYDEEDVYFYDSTPEYFYDSSVFNQLGGNFTVFVPLAIKPADPSDLSVFETKLIAEIELYKIYGTQYSIEYYG